MAAPHNVGRRNCADFNPTNDAQCEDRIHRIGQQHLCCVLRVASKDSVEEHISAIASEKVALQGAVLRDDPAPAALEKEALRRALARGPLGASEAQAASSVKSAQE